MSIDERPGIIDFSGKCLTISDVKQSIDELRKLVLGDSDLKTFPTDDKYMLRFLHCTNFEVAAAFKRIKDYTKLIVDSPDWFGKTSPLEKKEQIQDNSKAIIQGRDKNGRRILVVKLGALDASKTSPQEQAQIIDMYYESFLEEPETMENGTCVIVDMKGFSWKVFQWITPSNVRIGAKKLDLYPVKSIVIHIVNTSSLFNAAIKLIWPFLSDKIKDLFKFHFENWPSLYEHIDPGVLPPEYGGNGADINFEKSNEFLFSKSCEIENRLKCYKDIANK